MGAVTESDFKVDEHYAVGRVEICSGVDPISLQAKAGRKREFQNALGGAVQKATQGIFTHDVEVTIEWIIPDRRRYQTHVVADLDNVVKPILDAVTGPDGILVDDNQVQSIRIYWMDNGPDHGFRLEFRSLHPDDYIRRKGLTFVEFSADRCYMLSGGLGAHEGSFVAAWRRMVESYHELLELGASEWDAGSVLPIIRPYPRARLGRFQVRHEREFPESAE